jgi:hypothetical protein
VQSVERRRCPDGRQKGRGVEAGLKGARRIAVVLRTGADSHRNSVLNEVHARVHVLGVLVRARSHNDRRIFSRFSLRAGLSPASVYAGATADEMIAAVGRQRRATLIAFDGFRTSKSERHQQQRNGQGQCHQTRHLG